MAYLDRSARFVSDWASYLYIPIFVVSFVEVILRYVFNSPTIWVLELTVTLAGIQYAIGGVDALHRNAHIRIDSVYNRFPERLRAVLDVFSLLISACFLLILVFWGWKQAYPSVMMLETTASAWNSHQPAILKAVIPIAATLMFLKVIALIIRRLRGQF